MRISTLWKSGLLSLFLFGSALSLAYAQEATITGTISSAEEGAQSSGEEPSAPGDDAVDAEFEEVKDNKKSA